MVSYVYLSSFLKFSWVNSLAPKRAPSSLIGLSTALTIALFEYACGYLFLIDTALIWLGEKEETSALDISFILFSFSS